MKYRDPHLTGFKVRAAKRLVIFSTFLIFFSSVCSQAVGVFHNSSVPQLAFAAGGVENFNSAVDKLVSSVLLRRLLAQTDISYSNSLIESWWRSLKHQWLFLNTLDTVSSVRKLVSFYIEQHNTHLPHSAFRGQTPDEMYFGTGDHIPGDLHTAKKEARESRKEVNRSTSCPICESVINN